MLAVIILAFLDSRVHERFTGQVLDSKPIEGVLREMRPMLWRVSVQRIRRLVLLSVRVVPLAIRLTAEWLWQWLRRMTAVDDVDTLRAVGVGAGRPSTPMRLIGSRSR